MATVPHLDPPADPSQPDAPDGAAMNLLAAEWDRKMGLCLDGLSPLLAALQITNAYGCEAGDSILIGTKYAFTGTDADIIYLKDQPTYDHAGFVAAAAAATEVSRDAATGVMIVTPTTAGLDGVGVYAMEWSLEAHTRYDATDDLTYGLAFDTGGIEYEANPRPHRPHRYAVAELLLEGLAAFTIPWRTGGRWDRYQCFRVHNFSPISVTLTVENSASAVDDVTYTLAPYSCIAIRRHPETGTCSAPYRYLWQWRVSEGRPRFWRTGGSRIPELSSSANNLGSPAAVFLGWSAALGWEHDPGVDRDISPRFTGLFGSVASTSTRLGDLLHHQGTFWHVTWSGTTPVLTAGTFTGHANLVADMAAAGITVTVDGSGVITLASASTDDAIMCLGTNLMLLPDDAWGGLSVAAGSRAYRPLPVSLPHAMLAGTVPNVTADTHTAGVSRTWTISGTDYTAGASYDYETSGTSGAHITWALGTTIATVDAAFAADEPTDGSFSLAWNFGPQGVELIGSYTRRIRNIGSDAFLANWAGGEDYTANLYDSVEDDATATIAIRLVLCPYSFGNGWPTDIAGAGGTDPTHTTQPVLSLTPLKPRYYGLAPDVGSAVTETTDFGTRYGLTDPVKQARSVSSRPLLTRLQSVTATAPDSVRAQSYCLFPDDEGQAAYDALTLAVGGAYTNRLRFAAGRGAPYAAFDPLRYLRGPLDAVNYNHLAWQINSITRCRPAYDFADFFIGLDSSGSPFRLEQEHGGPLGGSIWPAAQYCRIDPGGTDILATAVAALGIPVLDLDDTQGGTAAAAAVAASEWTQWRYRVIRKYPSYVDNETAPGSGVYVRTTTYHDEPYNIAVETTFPYDPVHDYDVYSDPDYKWVSAADVAAYAASVGLPFRHRAFGVALKLDVIATQTPTFYGPSTSPDRYEYSAPFSAGSPPTPWVDGIYYGLDSQPSAWVRFMPATAVEDIGWLSAGASGWLGVGDAWRLDRRQIDFAVGSAAPGYEIGGGGGPGVTDVGTELSGGWGYAQPVALRSREFREEQTLGCLWTLMPDDINQTRLICLPYPAEEATIDSEASTGLGTTPPSPRTTVPWTVTAADPDNAKAVDFSASENLFRPSAHEAWKTRLVAQTYISLA